MEKRSLSFGTVKSDKGQVTADAPYGWVEGISNAYICDRYDELVLPTAFAAAAEGFMKNPVLSFGHGIEGNPANGTLPAGTVLKLWQDGQGNTHHRARWANTEDAQKVRGLYNDGDMRAFSVQFITLDSRPPTLEEVTKWPTLRRVITKLDLVEIACAVVPVNQGSLVTASKSLAGVRKLATPTEGATMDKRKLSDEEVKQMDALVANYNSTAEAMGNIALALDEMRAKAGEEDDHAPRMQKMVDGQKSLTTACASMGETCMALAKGFGISGDEPAAEDDAEEVEDPAAAEDEEATPPVKPGTEEEKPEDQAKAFNEHFTKALKA